MTAYKESLIDSRYLIFSTCRWLDGLCHIYHFVGIEVQANDSIIALRMLWLLFDAQAVAVRIKLCYSVSLGIAYPISKYRSFLVFLCSANSFHKHIALWCS